MKLSSNRDLYEYLFALASILRSRGEVRLSEDVTAASCTANTIPITEFLGESRIALRKVAAQENGVLNQLEREDLRDALSALDEAFEKRP